MTKVPYRSPETKALVAWLTAQQQAPVLPGIATPDDHVGWQGAPGISRFVGYHVVHAIDGGWLDGDLASPQHDADRPWQVSSIGATKDQAEQLADTILGLLCGPLPPLEIPGRSVLYVRADPPPGQARQDPDLPSLWAAHGLYRIATTPLT